MKNFKIAKISYNYFAKNLRFLRKSRNYSQGNVADILDLKRSTYTSYEFKRSQPNMEILYAISELYEISIRRLIAVDLENDNAENTKEVYEKIDNSVKIDDKQKQINELKAKVSVMEDFIRESIKTMMQTVKKAKDRDEGTN